MAAGILKELEKKLAVLRKQGEKGTKTVDALNDLSYALYGSDPEKSSQHAKEAVELALTIDYKQGQAVAYINMGITFFVRGSYEEALECYIKSLKINEELGSKKGIGNSSNNIGLIYLHTGDYERALDYLSKSLDAYKETGDRYKTAIAYNNLGVTLKNLERYDEAMEYNLKALEIYEGISEKDGIAMVYNNLGFLHAVRKEYTKALEYHHKGIEAAEAAGNKNWTAGCYSCAGGVYVELGEYDEALEYLEKGLALARESQAREAELAIYAHLAELHEKREDYRKALEYTRKHDELKSRIFSEENEDKIARLKLKHETEQKTRVAEIYRLKNEELERMVAERTAELEKELSERKRAEKIQTALLAITQAVSKTENLRELLGAMHRQLGTLLDASNFYVALYDEESDTYTFPYEVDQEDVGERYTPQQLKRSLTDYVRRQGKPLLVDDDVHKLLMEQGIVELVGAPSRVWMGVPLRTGERVTGVAVVQSYDENVRFTFEDLDVLNFVADGIALGIERKRAEEQLKEKLVVIQTQQEAILELSTPAIKIWRGVLVVPLIGVLDSKRARHLSEELLAAVSSSRSKVVIIDITGVPTVDSAVANHLLKTVSSVRLLGVHCVITGIRPEVARTVIHMGIDLAALETRATLAEGLRWAFRKTGEGHVG